MARNLAGTNIPPGNGGVVFPSPNEWPIMYRPVTGISISSQAQVTSVDHGFTSSDVGITQLDFSQVRGMHQINGQFGYIQSIVDDDNFTIGINTLNFSPYQAGGFCTILASPSSPTDPFSNTYP